MLRYTYTEICQMRYFPVFIKGERLRVLLIGGGAIAAAKLETLAGSGAQVTVVALAFGESVRMLALRYDCQLIQQAYSANLLQGCDIVVAATGDSATGEQIAADARAAGLWVNVVDNPPLCDFIFPAMIRRGVLQVAISTGGVSPVIARLLKQDFEQILPDGIEPLLACIKKQTPVVRKKLPDVQRRRLFWERVIRGPVGRMLSENRHSEAESWIESALAAAANRSRQDVLYIISIASYDPDDLTVRAVRQMGQADVILYEGGNAVLPMLERYARRDGEKYPVADCEDPVVQLADLGREGGVIVYLALVSNPAHTVRVEQLQDYAREHRLIQMPFTNAR
ncbi:MAG: NAD(P)-dependent oxidoreductase [Kiritimatiellia bacterium]